MDSRTRSLTRVAATHEERVRLLGVRRREGTLTKERLDLAAYVGVPEAREMLWVSCACGIGPDTGIGLCRDESLTAYARGLAGFGQEVARVALCAVSWELWSGWECDQTAWEPLFARCLLSIAEATSEQAVRDAIRDQVGSWALGEAK